MTSRYFKKVLNKKAKLERVQQLQMREHSPELQTMARLLI